MTEAIVRDLDEILDAAADDLRIFHGARLYVTGGTGFVGTWLLRAIAHANRRLDTQITVEALTRSAAAVKTRAPDLANDPAIRLVEGDILAPIASGAYDGVIHAATPSTGALNETDPARMLSLIVDGTRALVREVIAPSGAVPVLFTSSGAVYGTQPAELSHIPETYTGAPDPLVPSSSYHEGKRVAELILATAGAQGVGRARIARLFAFLGPGLPLDAHFAAGNFIRDALSGTPIRVRGDGTARRSYLYPTDMAAWCFAVFARGADARAYNVGSDTETSIRNLADTIAAAAGDVTVTVASPIDATAPVQRYVPDTSRIINELGVRRRVELSDAIGRTIAAHPGRPTRP